MLHVAAQRFVEEEEPRRLVKNRIGCDLLLARLFQHHPEEAAAVLRGVTPRCVDSDEPFIKHVQITVQQPTGELVPIKTLSGKPKVALIMKVTGERFKVTYEDMLSARRTKDLTVPRHVAMYLAKQLTLKSLPEIGREMGGRDHTTILHGVRKITAKLETDQKLRWDVEAVKERLTEILTQ